MDCKIITTELLKGKFTDRIEFLAQEFGEAIIKCVIYDKKSFAPNRSIDVYLNHIGDILKCIELWFKTCRIITFDIRDIRSVDSCNKILDDCRDLLFGTFATNLLDYQRELHYFRLKYCVLNNEYSYFEIDENLQKKLSDVHHKIVDIAMKMYTTTNIDYSADDYRLAVRDILQKKFKIIE